MKQIFFIVATIVFATSCQSQQSQAMKDQKKALDVVAKKRDADAITTTDGGWMMTAKINGKPWKANFMYPMSSTSRIIGHRDDEFISFPYSKQKMVVGKKIPIKDTYAADLFLNDGTGIYGGYNGEINITNVNGNRAEGNFHFTATAANGDGKTLEVTDGLFRIMISN